MTYKSPSEWLDKIIRGKKEGAISFTYTLPENGELELKEIQIEYEGVREAYPLRRREEDYVPFILWRLRGTKGVCVIEDEYGRRRYLPRIIVRAMEMAGRRIKVIACAPTLEELIPIYGVKP